MVLIKRCHQNNDGNIIFDECYSDYILVRNQCTEKCDSSNYRSHCSVCHEEEDKLDQCKQCKEGYYLPNDLEELSYCYSCPSSFNLVKVHIIIQFVLNVKKDIN